MLASDFCALACRRQCSCGGTQSQHSSRFTQRGRNFCSLARWARRSGVRLRAEQLSARVTSVALALFASNLWVLLVSYRTLAQLFRIC